MNQGPPKYEEMFDMFDDISGGTGNFVHVETHSFMSSSGGTGPGAGGFFHFTTNQNTGHSPRRGQGTRPSASPFSPLLQDKDVESLANSLGEIQNAIKIHKRPVTREYGE